MKFLWRIDSLFKNKSESDILVQINATKADAIKTDSKARKARWAIVKTLAESTNDSTSTFAQLMAKANANYESVGLDIDSWEAIEFLPLLISENYVKELPESRIVEGLAYLKNKPNALPRTGVIMEKRGQKDEAIALYKASDIWQCMDRYMFLMSKINKVEAYQQFMDWGMAGKLFPKMAQQYGSDIITYYITDPKTDKVAFKAKLSTMLIIYSNKMTNDQRKKEWGAFVSILKNTAGNL